MSQQSRVSKFFTFVFSSAFLGGLIAALVAPRMITWYAEPAVDMGFNCSSTVAWATKTLLKWQLIGAAVGVGLGLTLILILARRRRQKDADA